MNPLIKLFKYTGKTFVFPGRLLEMITDPDFDNDIIDHELISFRNFNVFLKEMYFETNKIVNIGKRNKVDKDFLLNPTIYDPFGNYKIKSRFNKDLPSTSMLGEEEDIDSYELFSEEDAIVYKFANQSDSAVIYLVD